MNDIAAPVVLGSVGGNDTDFRNGSVVIPGMREKQFPAGKYLVPCALIIGQRKASTDQKTSLNQALRDFAVPV